MAVETIKIKSRTGVSSDFEVINLSDYDPETMQLYGVPDQGKRWRRNIAETEGLVSPLTSVVVDPDTGNNYVLDSKNRIIPYIQRFSLVDIPGEFEGWALTARASGFSYDTAPVNGIIDARLSKVCVRLDPGTSLTAGESVFVATGLEATSEAFDLVSARITEYKTAIAIATASRDGTHKFFGNIGVLLSDTDVVKINAPPNTKINCLVVSASTATDYPVLVYGFKDI